MPLDVVQMRSVAAVEMEPFSLMVGTVAMLLVLTMAECKIL
jgi:hypothetical protein